MREKTKNLSFCPKLSLKWIVLQKSFMSGVRLSALIPWGFGNIWTTLNYLFNKKITKQIDSNQFMNVWQRPKP